MKRKQQPTLLETSSKQSEAIDIQGEDTHTRYSKSSEFWNYKDHISRPNTSNPQPNKGLAKVTPTASLEQQSPDAQYVVSNLSD
jgi:hypothetical protein